MRQTTTSRSSGRSMNNMASRTSAGSPVAPNRVGGDVDMRPVTISMAPEKIDVTSPDVLH